MALGESLRAGLLAPAAPGGDAGVMHHRALQERLNPPDMRPMVANRLLFHVYATERGLPVPRLFATVGRGTWGWSWRRDATIAPGDWEAALAGLPDDLVVAPVARDGGGRALRLRRTDDGWRRPGRPPAPTGRIAADLLEDPAADAWVVEERLHNHPALARLGDGSALHVVRLVTCVDPFGSVRQELPALRVTGYARPGDAEGRAARAWLRIDETGGLAGPVRGDDPEAGLDPATGRCLRGERVPLWSDVAALAVRTAEAFLPLRTLALRIAVTAAGPVLLGADHRWEPLPGEDPGPALAALEAGA